MLDYDTVVVLDSHWATTVEFVVTAQDRRAGLFTSEELPRGMVRRPYDFPGDPELARAIAAKADEHGTWITAIDDPYLPIFYATTNLWEYLGRGLDKRWVSIGVCQTADTEDNLRLGRALGQAIAETDRKVVLIASGALSHTFWPLRELREHEAAGVEHIFTPQAAAADFQRLEWFRHGDHARVLETMPEFYRFKPEARFGHYLMMIGALGEGDCTARQPAVRGVRELRGHRPGAPVVRAARGRLPPAAADAPGAADLRTAEHAQRRTGVNHDRDQEGAARRDGRERDQGRRPPGGGRRPQRRHRGGACTCRPSSRPRSSRCT